MSDAVLPLMDSMYDSLVRETSKAVLSSPTCPWHSRPMVAASRPATSVPSEAAISEALANRKSPARMATRLPQRAFTLSTPRRLVASSMTSSW